MQSPKKYTNKLINETSPYLLQHAHNPVDWYPWGNEAFERAKAEDKPVLVSIGYSACHWCHVMEHESFEDEAAARVQNENFINIKVDREERPDVDQIYMNFVQITTGRGGWPMNVFLTPEKVPFFGGTYFPPAPRYGMASWQQILASIAEAWRERRDELMRSATDILGELRRISVVSASSDSQAGGLLSDVSDAAYRSLAASFDAKNGGWGGAPKFPQAMAMEFLLRYWKRTGESAALEMVRKTAEKMARGGVYDQLGGGFHRYAVDAVWLVPHFEKMLYDNAQLVRVYLHLYQAGRHSGEVAEREQAEFFRNVAIETLEYVRREMLDSSGGFYSSQDADSEGEEGKFFVWTPDEVIAVLGEADGNAFNEYYDITPGGNFEGSSIPNREFGVQGKDKIDEARLAEMRSRLFAAREFRIKPFRDEKVLTAWNGMMLAAFAEAAAVLEHDEYRDVAKRNANFLLESLLASSPPYEGGVASAAFQADDGVVLSVAAQTSSKRPRSNGEQPSTTPSAQGGHPSLGRKGEDIVLRTWKDGTAKLNGYIEDYANLADGLIELFQVSGEILYLSKAKELAEAMITEFWDADDGGFFFTSNDHEELIVRNKDLFDNATPSGNSVAADVLLRLAKFYGDERFERFGLAALRVAASQIRRYPQGFGRALAAAEFDLADVKEVVIVGEPGNELESELWSHFLPAKVVVPAGTQNDGTLSLLEGREMAGGNTTAYVCENFVCQQPVTSPAELAGLLVGSSL